jgi:glycosyltransferase involved in cell wall biosynthesis
MTSVAFYLDNSRISGLDFKNSLIGNPGTGATEFMTVLISSLLASRGIDVVLYVKSPGNFPHNLAIEIVQNLEEAISKSAHEKRILVIRAYLSGMKEVINDIQRIPESRVLVWAHLTPNQSDLRLMADTSQILQLICLENNQRVRLLDNPIHNKSLTIPYGISGSTTKRHFDPEHINIVYIGAIVPQKGIHFLTDIWDRVLNRFPKAKLIVLGSSSLYGDNFELGPRKIADIQFEKRIFKNVKSSEHSIFFLGNLDANARNLVLNSATLGIVNPSGSTETFCLSAVEFQQRGIPVISARKYGLLDTVKNKKSGYLVLHRHFLYRKIVKLILHPNLNLRMGNYAQNRVIQKYDLLRILKRWENLFEHLSSPYETPLMKESKDVKIASLQALLGLINRPMVRKFSPFWPTQVELWLWIKRLRHSILG